MHAFCHYYYLQNDALRVSFAEYRLFHRALLQKETYNSKDHSLVTASMPLRSAALNTSWNTYKRTSHGTHTNVTHSVDTANCKQGGTASRDYF